MFKIEDDVIYITRGDNAVLEVTAYIDDEQHEQYTLEEGDYYTLTVRKVASDISPVILQIPSTNGRIVIQNEDTANAEVGKYSADIQLTTASGDRYTIWPKFDVTKPSKEYNFKNFCIMPEVTRV